MPNDYFQFKQFTIKQDKCAMKVGTDGVLLGAWTNVENAKTILDIGTGTGLIALMLAQRSEAQIIGIEIDTKAAQQATENIANSKWKNRIKIVNQDFLQYTSQTEDKFDLIVSNPPYFENALPSPKTERTIARHNQQLNYKTLFEGVSKILSENGGFSLIFPSEYENKIIEICLDCDLYISRICYVKPTPTKNPKRTMMEFRKQKKPLTKSTIIIENGKRHEYSEEYIELTKNFYLNF